MTKPGRRDVFRYRALITAGVVVGGLICVSGLVYESRERGLMFYVYLLLALFFVAALSEVAILRIELRDDAIWVRRLFREQRYLRTDVIDVTWERGGGVALKLAGGNWAKLPNTGHASTKIVGAIRAWINEGR